MACVPRCGSVKDVQAEEDGVVDTIFVHDSMEDESSDQSNSQTPLLSKDVSRRSMIFKYNDEHRVVEANDGPNGTWEVPVPSKDKPPPMRHARSIGTFLCLLWLLVGFLVYVTGDEDWNAAKSFFFAVNVGLGVGYSYPHIVNEDTEWFTCFYCMVGTSLVMTTLTLHINVFLEHSHDFVHSQNPEAKISVGQKGYSRQFLKNNVVTISYILWLGVGIWFGLVVEEFGGVLDSILFALTAMTTAGMINPRDNNHSLWLTSLYILVGIPLHGVFWGLVVDKRILAFLDHFREMPDPLHPDVATSHSASQVIEKGDKQSSCLYVESSDTLETRHIKETAEAFSAKRYQGLYTLVDSTKELDDLDGMKAATIKKKLSGIWLCGTELTVYALLCSIWGIFSIAFMILSIIIFMVLDPNLTLDFATFFVVNVGLGVGYTKYDIHGWGSKLYLIFFCCIMTSFFCGFLLLMISHLSEVGSPSGSMLKTKITLLYIFWLLVGTWWFMTYEGGDMSDAFMFSVTALTTAGVQAPLSNDFSYMFTSAYLLIGVPINGYMWGLWSDYFLEPYYFDEYMYHLPQANPRIYVKLKQALANARKRLSKRTKPEPPADRKSSFFRRQPETTT